MVKLPDSTSRPHASSFFLHFCKILVHKSVNWMLAPCNVHSATEHHALKIGICGRGDRGIVLRGANGGWGRWRECGEGGRAVVTLLFVSRPACIVCRGGRQRLVVWRESGVVVMPFIIFFLFSARTMRSFVTLGVTYVCGRRCSAWCGACRFYRLQTLWRGATHVSVTVR